MREASSENCETAAAFVSPSSESQPVAALEEPHQGADCCDDTETQREPRNGPEPRTPLGRELFARVVLFGQSGVSLVEDGEPALVVALLDDDYVLGVPIESVALAVDLLRPSIGSPCRAGAQRAHEKLHFEPDREEEHDEYRNRIP